MFRIKLDMFPTKLDMPMGGWEWRGSCLRIYPEKLAIFRMKLDTFPTKLDMPLGGWE